MFLVGEENTVLLLDHRKRDLFGGYENILQSYRGGRKSMLLKGQINFKWLVDLDREDSKSQQRPRLGRK